MLVPTPSNDPLEAICEGFERGSSGFRKGKSSPRDPTTLGCSPMCFSELVVSSLNKKFELGLLGCLA